MVECRTKDPEVPSSNFWYVQKENLSQVQSEHYHHQSLCTRVKYLKLSEVKTRNCCGTVVEIQRSPVQTLVMAKRKSLVQSEHYHHQSLCTRVKYLKLSR